MVSFSETRKIKRAFNVAVSIALMLFLVSSPAAADDLDDRSEERSVGKECALPIS